MNANVKTHRAAGLFLGGLLLASVFALAITKTEDTDAWTHLALGREIIQHRGFPATEQFNFPSLELPYYNSEWLFGLVFYLAYVAGGFAGVIVLKAAMVTLAFLVLFKDSLIPEGRGSHRLLGVVAATAVLFPILLMVKHRFVERPDIALMVFLGFTIYALNAYVYEGRRYVYLLPGLQVLWVNMHPSIIVGTVPFIAVLIGGTIQRVLHRWRGIELPGTPTVRQLRTIGAVFAGVLVAFVLNPYGPGVLMAPFDLAGSSWHTHEIAELQPPRFPAEMAPFIVVVLLVLGFGVTVKRISVTMLLLVTPFAIIGLSARRFVFLLAMVAAPVLGRQLRMLAGRLSLTWARQASVVVGGVVALLVGGITGLYLAGVEPFVDSVRKPGIGVSYVSVPEGALRYLDRNGLGGRVFNTFQYGGYIVWRDYPRRVPIVDGRGHLPPGLLEEITLAPHRPSRLERLQKRYGFEIAIVHYPLDSPLEEQTPDVDGALASPDWALVYWDDLALVYLRRTESLATIIERDEYRYVKPANGALYLRQKLSQANVVVAIEAELRRNIAETQSSVGFGLLGFVYNDVGSYEKAIEVLRRVRDFPRGSYLKTAYAGLGFAYSRRGDIARSIEYYEKAARLGRDPDILYNMGINYAKIGNDREAIRYFEWALNKNKHLAFVYPSLIRAYRRIGRTDRAQKLETKYQEALAHTQGEEHFKRGTKFYLEKDFHKAIEEFKASIKVNPRNPSPRSNLGYVYFDLGLLDLAYAEQKAALDVDPNFANAHYGLALVYRMRGDHAKGREHLEEYLRLEPRGYWARKAQEGLSRLPRR